MKSIIVKYLSDGHGVRETEYAVNQSGNGLWMNGKQVIGTCDFHASTPRDLVRKLRAGSTIRSLNRLKWFAVRRADGRLPRPVQPSTKGGRVSEDITF